MLGRRDSRHLKCGALVEILVVHFANGHAVPGARSIEDGAERGPFLLQGPGRRNEQFQVHHPNHQAEGSPVRGVGLASAYRFHKVAACLSRDRVETERLVLRRWQDSDLGPFADLNADPVVMEYFPSTLSRSESDAFVEQIEASFERSGMGLFAVELKGGGDFIGFIGLRHIGERYPFAPAVEVGWRFRSKWWGLGFAPEGAGACLDLAFGIHDLEEVVSMTAVVNARSRRVMEKIRMTRDAKDDFEHPRVPVSSLLRPHVLYRARR
jgi:RimJ/RimL family protein N-acetyltransferase